MFKLRIVVTSSNLLLSRCALNGEDDSYVFEDREQSVVVACSNLKVTYIFQTVLSYSWMFYL